MLEKTFALFMIFWIALFIAGACSLVLPAPRAVKALLPATGVVVGSLLFFAYSGEAGPGVLAGVLAAVLCKFL